MNISTLVIGGLAVWRLSHAVVKESGPLMVFDRMRAYFARTHKRSGGLFDLLSCVYCTSLWIGLVAALWFAGDVFQWFMYGLAFSAVSMLLEIYFTSKLKHVRRTRM